MAREAHADALLVVHWSLWAPIDVDEDGPLLEIDLLFLQYLQP